MVSHVTLAIFVCGTHQTFFYIQTACGCLKDRKLTFWGSYIWSCKPSALCSWGVPLIITIAAVCMNKIGYDASEVSVGWCWVRIHAPDRVLWMLLTGKIWEFLAYLTLPVLYILIKRHIHIAVRTKPGFDLLSVFIYPQNKFTASYCGISCNNRIMCIFYFPSSMFNFSYLHNNWTYSYLILYIKEIIFNTSTIHLRCITLLFLCFKKLIFIYLFDV